jgi:hypothetical protein
MICLPYTVFEDKELADKATIAVEKTIHFEAHDESRVEEVRVIGPNKDVEK